jgi:hypothetical protein
MFEGVFTSQKEINNLTYDDVLDFNFIQNFLHMVDSNEFIVDENMENENLINHICYMIKQYLRKRNFDPASLINGLKTQLLDEEFIKESNEVNSVRNSNLTFHHGFEDYNEGDRKLRSGYVFEEPKWFMIKIVFLISFLNKDKKEVHED